LTSPLINVTFEVTFALNIPKPITMQALIEILKKETQSLKVQYIEKTIEWARSDYDRLVERATWEEENWAKYLGVGTSVYNEGTSTEFVSFEKGFYNTKHAARFDREQTQARKVARMSVDEYLEIAEKNAQHHYEDSIEKLAFRIEKKGLNQDNLSVETAHIAENIETTLTDGVKTVRAFTILAWGQIQRPHYRYLIK